MKELADKIMTVQEAISRFVRDGDQLVIGNYTVGSCAELVYEVIRQEKKGLRSIRSPASLMSKCWWAPVAWKN